MSRFRIDVLLHCTSETAQGIYEQIAQLLAADDEAANDMLATVTLETAELRRAESPENIRAGDRL